MPYIKESHRKYLEENPNDIKSTGELNYMFTKIAMEYLKLHGLSYATINSIVGAMECSKQEFYRRVVVPYENAKMAENGDVYS